MQTTCTASLPLLQLFVRHNVSQCDIVLVIVSAVVHATLVDDFGEFLACNMS